MREEDFAAVAALVRASGTSFYRGMRVLPRERRGAMYGIYAFCRLVDDIADEPAPLAEKTARLDAWRERIAALAAGSTGRDAVERALAEAIGRYALDPADFLAVIEGMAMDAGAPIVAPDLATLDLYCDRVAAAVGRLSVRVFGEPSAAGLEVAYHLGRALQLTNILRDLAEDAAQGRLYLPAEWLAEAAVPPEPTPALAAPGLARVCERAAAEAERHFAAARAAMARCDSRAMRPARLMGGSYVAILAALRRRGWERPGERVRLARLAKLRLAARALWP
ncbi:MAG: presqualene diphosphate synthase HpnD [Acetobacteraceae bacterium]